VASGFAAIELWSERLRNSTTFRERSKSSVKTWVLFRDQFGQVGLLGEHCPHRGASLEYGDIEDGGLRCPYHGWLFNVRGQCLEMPAEPKDSK